MLRFTVPEELRDVERVRFTVPLLLLLVDLFRFTVPELRDVERFRFTVPELRDVERFRFTVPELLFVERFLFTVPLFVLLDPLRLRTVDEDRERFTVDLVLFTRSVRAEERTFVLTALRPTLASFRVERVTFVLLRDERALVLGL